MTIKPKIYLVTFADTSLSIALHRFVLQAKATKLFNHIFAYNDTSLPLSFWDEFKHLVYRPINELDIEQWDEKDYRSKFKKDTEPYVFSLKNFKDNSDSEHTFKTRTTFNKTSLTEVPTWIFGYGVFKPVIISEVLKQIPENSYLLYLDAGFWLLNPNAVKKSIDQFIEDVKDIPVGTGGNTFLTHKYTYKELYDFYGVPYDENKGKTMALSGIEFMRNCPEARNTMQDWLAPYRDPEISKHLYRSPKNKEIEYPLHDQSAISLLMCRNQVVQLTNPYAVFGDSVTQKDIDNPEKSRYGIVAARDKIYMPIELQSQMLFQRTLTQHINNYNSQYVIRDHCSNIETYLELNYPEQYNDLLERQGGLRTGVTLSDETKGMLRKSDTLTLNKGCVG